MSGMVHLSYAQFMHNYSAVAARYNLEMLSEETQVLYVPAYHHEVVELSAHSQVCVIADEYAQVSVIADYSFLPNSHTNKTKTEKPVRPAEPAVARQAERLDERRGELDKTVRSCAPGYERENKKNSKMVCLYAHQNASITYTTIHMGSGNHDIELFLLGRGAHISVYGVYGAAGIDHYRITTKQEHGVPGATSSLLIKGIVGGNALSEYAGTIIIGENAAQSNANQQAAALLVSPQARARSMPSLQVLTNDVRCKHGSAVGQLNQDQLFYAQARGLSQEEARRLLMHGFLMQAVTHIPADRATTIIERIVSMF